MLLANPIPSSTTTAWSNSAIWCSVWKAINRRIISAGMVTVVVIRSSSISSSSPTADAQGGPPKVILIASGSEVSLALEAYERLSAEGIAARVVSLPCWELFEHQSADYRESVLPQSVTARISIEQAATFGWGRYVGDAGRTIGMKTFGASAPLKELQKKFGFTPDQIVTAAKQLIG